VNKALRRRFHAYLLFWARVVVRVRRPCVVGITGSVGKTTTKEAVAAVLRHPDARRTVGDVWATPGNRNEPRDFALLFLGRERAPTTRGGWIAFVTTLPLRALALATAARYPDVFVVECAATRLGSLRARIAVARPTIAIVTAVGPAHLETFKTLDNIRHEKAELVRATPPWGLVVLAQDSEHVATMDREARAPVVKVPGRGREFALGAARVVGRHLGVPDEVVDRALGEFGAVVGRLDVMELGSVTVIDDSFNANPLSMQLGLDTLAERARPGQRRVAILGMMAELGPESARYHEEIGGYARARADVVVGVGEVATHYRPDRWFPTSAACADGLSDLVRPSDCILVKGSHSVHLRQVVRRLVADGAEARAGA